MHRRELLNLLDRHRTRFMDEAAHVTRTRAFVAAHQDCFHCDLWPGHVTGSAWVVNPGRDSVLLLHHRKHNQWFQPGGHADGDADILRVALRETSEETGLDPSHIRLVEDAIFDVDIHRIPARGDVPAHEHFDVRFLFQARSTEVAAGSDAEDARWVALSAVDAVESDASVMRAVRKLRYLTGL